jgi:hypothetical protein
VTGKPVWEAGIDESGTAGTEQSFHLLNRFVDNTARLAGYLFSSMRA